MNKLSIATIGLIAGTIIGVLIGHVKGARAEERPPGQIAAKWGTGLEKTDHKSIHVQFDSAIEGAFLITEAELKTKTELRIRSLGLKPIEGMGKEIGEGYLGIQVNAKNGFGLVTIAYYRPAFYSVNGNVHEYLFTEPLTQGQFSLEGSVTTEDFYKHAFGPALDNFLNRYLKANEGK